MRTLRQQLASRQNGKKSRGPVTAEGRARSSQNAVKHGLNSKVVVLANESHDDFNQCVASYFEFWRPANAVEADLVNDIAAARWRLSRTVSMETASLDLEIDRKRAETHEMLTRTDEATRCAIAFDSLAQKGRGLRELGRTEVRLRRTIERATEKLIELRELRTRFSENEPGDGELRPILAPGA